MKKYKVISKLNSTSMLVLIVFMSSSSLGQSELSVSELVVAEMISKSIPGLSVSVITEGESIVQSFGIRNSDSTEFVNNETVFEAASLSKPVFALLVLELAQENVLDIDTPVHQYTTADSDFGAAFFEDDSYQKITPRMVLSHSSGLPNGTSTPGKIHFEPGSDFAYSGTGFRYLAAAIETITGRSLEVLLDEYVFQSLGMQDSSFLWRTEYSGNVAWGHDASGKVTREILHLEDVFPEGGLLTTIEDYSRFVGRIIERYQAGDPVVTSMVSPAIVAEDYGTQGQMLWGLGWGIERASLGDRIWHTGSNGAFKSFVLVDLDTESAVIFFANGENGLEIIPPLMRSTIGGTALSDFYQRTISASLRY